MKSTSVIFPLVVAVSATPTPCVGPVPNDVAVAINRYVFDIDVVNGMIDNPATGLDFGLEQTTDETTQLATLASVCGDAAYDLNVQKARQTTQQILGAISNVRGNVTAPSQTLEAINHARCCILFPTLDSIFSFAAKTIDLRGVARTTAPRPDACQNATVVC